MPYIRLFDFDMYYEDEGIGEPIIFIHGSLTTGTETFKKQIQLLKNEYRCICVDLRGHGRSFWDTYDWNTETLSEDIIQLMDKLNIEKAHLIGHSMGGDIAMNCAINHAVRVKTLTAISTAGMVNANIIMYLILDIN